MSIFKKSNNPPVEMCPVCGNAPEIITSKIDNGYVANTYCDADKFITHIKVCAFGKDQAHALRATFKLWNERCRIGKEYIEANGGLQSIRQECKGSEE